MHRLPMVGDVVRLKNADLLVVRVTKDSNANHLQRIQSIDESDIGTTNPTMLTWDIRHPSKSDIGIDLKELSLVTHYKKVSFKVPNVINVS